MIKIVKLKPSLLIAGLKCFKTNCLFSYFQRYQPCILCGITSMRNCPINKLGRHSETFLRIQRLVSLGVFHRLGSLHLQNSGSCHFPSRDLPLQAPPCPSSCCYGNLHHDSALRTERHHGRDHAACRGKSGICGEWERVFPPSGQSSRGIENEEIWISRGFSACYCHKRSLPSLSHCHCIPDVTWRTFENVLRSSGLLLSKPGLLRRRRLVVLQRRVCRAFPPIFQALSSFNHHTPSQQLHASTTDHCY